MAKNGMTQEEFEADEDLNAYLHQKAWRIAEDNHTKMLEQKAAEEEARKKAELEKEESE